MDIFGRPVDDLGWGLGGEDGSENLVAPEAVRSQGVEVEGQGEANDGENCEHLRLRAHLPWRAAPGVQVYDFHFAPIARDASLFLS